MELLRRRDILVAPDATVGAARIEVDDDVAEHTHDFLEIAFVTRGRAEHVSATGSEVVERGSVAVIRPGSWHAYRRLEPLTVLNLYLAPELLHRELSWVLDHPGLAVRLLHGGPTTASIPEPSLARAVVWLDQLATIPSPRLPSTLLGLATCVVGELVDADFPPSAASPVAPSPFVRQAMALLADDLEAPWTMSALAKRARVSQPHLQRAFRTQVGISPMAWLNQLRGEAAARLLVQTDLPISEVGRLVGWSDPNYASRRFRALYEVTPSAYRARFTP